MYVFAIFPSPRVNFAFRSPSGGDSAGPFPLHVLAFGSEPCGDDIVFRKSGPGFIVFR